MKWIFIPLLVLNIVYFGWELDQETRLHVQASRSALSIPATAKQLQLISEMEAPPGSRVSLEFVQTPVAVKSMEAEPPATGPDQLVAELPDIRVSGLGNIVPAYSCYRYGPIPDEELVKGLQDWFRSRNTLTQIRTTEEQASSMFWIYLTPQQSRETALAILEEMKSKGIGDYRLINRGDLVNAISLGLFSSREAVAARLLELKEKGYVPVVVPYTDLKKIYWLDIRVADTSTAMEEMYNGYPVKFTSVPVICGDNFSEESVL